MKFNLKTNDLITEGQNEDTARIRSNKQVTKIERLDIKMEEEFGKTKNEVEGYC